MVQRTECLCDGKIIGIESIYTVINGKQINIPEKLEALRAKSRNNELLCHCGCGAVLTLVAGEKNLRKQHFRLRDAHQSADCSYVGEGKISVDSKIVLKCWLDEKIIDADMESRVPISWIGDTDRKYEFTFLSKKKNIGLIYNRKSANISDEKFDVIEQNEQGIKIVYIVDSVNVDTMGQYPENMMKIQKRQGYCLYLSVEGLDYYKAKAEAAFFDKDIDGLWKNHIFAKGKLSDFEIGADGKLMFKGTKLFELRDDVYSKYSLEKKRLKKQRDEEKKLAEERLKKLVQEQMEMKQRQRKEEEKAAKIKADFEERERKKKEEEDARQAERAKKFRSIIESGVVPEDYILRDENEMRWVKCLHCGKIKPETEFKTYGGKGKINVGLCNDCFRNNPDILDDIIPKIEVEHKPKSSLNICPQCGGELKQKSGRFGKFWGCCNYPRCRYTRS